MTTRAGGPVKRPVGSRPDKSITLPATSVVLSGTVAADGKPYGRLSISFAGSGTVVSGNEMSAVSSSVHDIWILKVR